MRVKGSRVSSLWKFRRRFSVIVMHNLAALCTYVFAVCLVHGGAPRIISVLRATLLPLLLLRFASFVLFGFFKSSVRHASIPDLVVMVKTVTASSVAFVLLAHWFPARLPIHNAVIVLDWALLLMALCLLHFGTGIYRAHRSSRRTNTRRVLIVGAGESGGALLKELTFNPSSPSTPVALLDDDPTKVGARICGVPVVSDVAQLPKVVREKSIDQVFICIPTATTEQMSRILALCRQVDVPVKTLPSLRELLDGRVSLRDLRDVSIEDLLCREATPSDSGMIKAVVRGKRVLVTGAGGSIGSELCRQIAAADPRTLVLAEKSENSLFYLEMELKEKHPNISVIPVLLDVTRAEAVARVFEEYVPEVVFHAAAHKHVRILELWPAEAIRNNIIGTRNVAVTAARFRCERFVNISTDKAVNPRCYMGLSKRITEMCIQRLAEQSSTRFMNVRFGNVAGSSGSVLRLFWDRVRKGAPLRVTDARATRYFMTIPEAVNLIIQAAGEGRGGETFVFDMGDPVNIYELARTVSLFAGLKPDHDILIQIVGLGKGEKLEEELWEYWEHPVPSMKKGIRFISDKHPASASIWEKVALMEDCLLGDEYERALRVFRSAIPEFELNHQPPRIEGVVAEEEEFQVRQAAS
jgi:FlaA1/EpsC-like NDP-sugar epimerase